VGAHGFVHAADRAVAAASGKTLKLDRTLVAIVAAGVALAAVPFLHLPAFYESFLYLVLHWIVLATSWNILSGYSGYFSFGHGAFFGTGVYTTAVLAGKYDVPFLWTLPVAALLASLLGVALGAVVFRVRRVRGEVFALLTLAVTFVLATIVLNTPIDGGPGVYLSAVAVPALAPTASGAFYMMALVLAVVTLMIARAIPQARLGLGLFAIHDDEDAAEVMGVPTYRYKLIALGISCALAGVAGGIQALFVSYVTANSTFNITVPLTVILMSVLGGTRHWAGPSLGATAITLLLYASTAADQALTGKAVSGAILVAAVLFMPNGILELLRAKLTRRGQIIALPSALEVTRPATQATSDRVDANGATAESGAPFARESESAAKLQAAGTGPEPPATAPTGQAMLTVRALRKSFRGVHALDGVDLDVHEGEILGILGPNGSGKSTLINVVSGHYRADGGSVRFLGRELADLAAHRIARAGIARTYQIPRPFAHLSVRDNVALTAMFGLAALDRAAADGAAMQWLAFTDLRQRAAAMPGDLNLHQTKFLELARALASKPRLLMLDEVLSGLTPAEIDEAVDLIRRIRDQGTTIILVEHVMRVVTELSDRIVVLDQGRVLAQGKASDIMARDDVAIAYLGVSRA
jgi:branched-chain amino acid transport system permease protein